MHPASFTLEEAQEIREDFEDLIDTEFRNNGSDFYIDEILIEPTDTNGFDVIVAASDEAGNKILIPIHHYVEQNGISYNFPGN